MKNILTTTCILFVFNLVHAQFKIGFTAGVNIANVSPAYVLTYNGQQKNIKGKTITNFSAGIHNDVSLNKNIDLRLQH